MFSYDIDIEQLDREIQAKMKIDVLSLSGHCKDGFVGLMQMADDLSLYRTKDGDTVLLSLAIHTKYTMKGNLPATY